MLKNVSLITSMNTIRSIISLVSFVIKYLRRNTNKLLKIKWHRYCLKLYYTSLPVRNGKLLNTRNTSSAFLLHNLIKANCHSRYFGLSILSYSSCYNPHLPFTFPVSKSLNYFRFSLSISAKPVTNEKNFHTAFSIVCCCVLSFCTNKKCRNR